MSKVEIYTKPTCPFCIRAKSLLDRKGVKYQEVDVSSSDKQDAMMQKANGRRSVPQIFINGEHVGGCDDLHALDAKGLLDQKLNS